jgi:hypothetical protein
MIQKILICTGIEDLKICGTLFPGIMTKNSYPFYTSSFSCPGKPISYISEFMVQVNTKKEI